MNWTSADVNRATKTPAAAQAPRKAAAATPVPAGANGGRRAQPESALQMACLAWFRATYPALARLLWAIPNGGRRGKAEAARLKQEGVAAGAPDLLLAVPTAQAPALFLELKAGRNKASAAQRDMHQLLQRQGYRVTIVYALPQFQADVRHHLGY